MKSPKITLLLLRTKISTLNCSWIFFVCDATRMTINERTLGSAALATKGTQEFFTNNIVDRIKILEGNSQFNGILTLFHAFLSKKNHKIAIY